MDTPVFKVVDFGAIPNATTDNDTPVQAAVNAARAATCSDTTIADVMVRCGLVQSRGEARRIAEQGGVGVNGEKVKDVDQSARPFRSAGGAIGAIHLQVGKRVAADWIDVT